MLNLNNKLDEPSRETKSNLATFERSTCDKQILSEGD